MLETLKRQARPSLVLMLIFTGFLGILYPSFVIAIVQDSFRRQFEYGLVRSPSGQVLASIFSSLPETRPQYAWGPIYGPQTSACVLLHPPLPVKCQKAIAMRIADLNAYGSDGQDPVPSDLVRIAASRLDLEIDLDAAQYQANRIATIRHIPPEQVQAAIRASTHNSIHNMSRGLYVNLLELNLRLDGKLK